MGRDTDRKTSGGSMRSCSRTARTVWKRMNGQRTGRMFLMPGMNGGARRAGAYTIAAGTGLSYYWLRQQTDKPQFVRIVHHPHVAHNHSHCVPSKSIVSSMNFSAAFSDKIALGACL